MFWATPPPELWRGQLDQVLVRGTRWITEVAFFHRSSKTLILVDLLENITDATPNTNWQLKLWWKLMFRMRNNPKPAPEYQLGWADKELVRASLRAILAWPFERVVIAHGELIETNARAVLERAWAAPLSGS